MDRHDLAGVTAADVADAHVKDLQAQDGYGVNYITYWFDYERQHAFCLAKGPNREAVEAVHRVAHGLVANQVIEVDGSAVGRFLGDIVEHAAGEPYVETAFRAIMFTDLEGSTRLTHTLGDARAMEVVHRHDEIVREALRRTGGTEVKHTGDGIMASFVSVSAAIEAALRIQRSLAEAGADQQHVVVRIGIAAGEPVTENDDLFGATVQLAARLTARAKPHAILVSTAVRDLVHGKGFRFEPAKSFRLKGFDGPVSAAEVIWRRDG